MTKKLIAALTLLALVMSVFSLYGQEKKKPNDETKPSFWMRKKLEYSQNILSGLAKADFEEIAKQMQGLAQIEEFVRGRNEDYRTQLKSFHFANRELIRMSEEENVDGAALAYVQLTLSGRRVYAPGYYAYRPYVYGPAWGYYGYGPGWGYGYGPAWGYRSGAYVGIGVY
ncbi:MAG TPA: hypothetical protein VND64_07485 [Pirellulales bacterium]|nr:hypothetical protein [Pirellulales bacterium]